jgi:hypothetical protein
MNWTWSDDDDLHLKKVLLPWGFAQILVEGLEAWLEEHNGFEQSGVCSTELPRS